MPIKPYEVYGDKRIRVCACANGMYTIDRLNHMEWKNNEGKHTERVVLICRYHNKH